ncbi:MAG: 4-hydroxythreonine-4-phosphate dehydrogenase PdxA [Bacteroidetes bacterium]|nr:4-hydroxythreonine-4-phosphate dehydrogenase PdxA [Bacteroidota bacterium]
MSSEKIKVGITQGDPNGIGLEVIIKTFMDTSMLEVCTPVLFGSQKTFSFHRKAMNVEIRFNQIRSAEQAMQRQLNILNVYEEEIPIEFGTSTQTAGKYALKSIGAACEALEQKKIDVLVTAPINKHNIQSEQFQFKGHTDYLENRFKNDALMLMCSDKFRVGVVTGHVPLANVSAIINQDKIVNKIKLLNKSLLEDFGIRKPKIAVLGLNPHAGDNGTIGGEEAVVIVPAIAKAKSENIMVMGPYSADGFFGTAMHMKFDAVLAMYHDQGLVPFKALAFDSGVNYTAGLPVIRTSPDHGVGYDIAGQNKASETSFRSAVYLACDIFRTRKGEKEIYAHPLRSYSQERE